VVEFFRPITKGGGGFKIDHPLDPTNKHLWHSFVESPDMKNIYDGVTILDERGEAVVELPDWFEALNRDFRYQLTAICGAAPNLHIAEEVAGNRFRIAGGMNTYSKNIKYHEGFPDTPKIRAAITDLVELIIDHYPEATFDVTASPEDTQVVHLCTTVDRIDTDELVDLVIDREMAGF
jgi:hypothetical protein